MTGPRPAGPPRRRPRTIALAALTAAAALLLAGCRFDGLYGVPLPGGAAQGADVYHVTVEFADVLDLVPQSAVKVNDVTVGAVEKIDLDGWHAKVRLRIENSVRLPDNAVADLRQTSLLGEKYVALSAPTDVPSAGRLHEGSVIPLARSGRNPEVEEVLSALSALLNGGGVAQLHTITVELNSALGGREDRLRDLLAQLDTFVGGLDAQRADILRALDGVDKLSKTLGDQSSTIAQAVDRMPPALKVLADDRAQLTRLLTALSDLGAVGTQVINASQADLVASLRRLAPILTELNQAGNDLPNALDLLLTYPLPQNIVSAIKGDYANLKVTADLNLNDLYHNLAGAQPGAPAPTPAPTAPGPLPLPSLPPLPLPSLPPVPLPSLPGCVLGCASPTPSSSSGGGALCPPLCLGTADYQATRIDPVLAAMMLEGMGA